MDERTELTPATKPALLRSAHEASLSSGLTGDLGPGIILEAGVEDSIGDLDDFGEKGGRGISRGTWRGELGKVTHGLATRSSPDQRSCLLHQWMCVRIWETFIPRQHHWDQSRNACLVSVSPH